LGGVLRYLGARGQSVKKSVSFHAQKLKKACAVLKDARVKIHVINTAKHAVHVIMLKRASPPGTYILKWYV
jgi:hypothetical protein